MKLPNIINVSLALLLSLFANLAYSGTEIKLGKNIDTDRLYSDETVTHYVAIQKYISESLGMGFKHSYYDTPYKGFNANSIYLLSNYKSNKLDIVGTTGVSQLTNHSDVYYSGDIYLNYKLHKYMTLSSSVYGDAVESYKALIEGYTYYGYGLGLELHNDVTGTVVSLHKQEFSDSNSRDVINGKFYYSFMDGVAIYTSHRLYQSSKGYNGIYFNPDDYERHNVGLSYRLRNGNFLYTGYLQTGKDRIDKGDTRPAHGFKFRVDYLPKGIYLSVLSDYTDDTNYRYLATELGLRF